MPAFSGSRSCLATVLALAFGALPALQARRLALARVLAADESRTGTSSRHSRSLRASLIVGEIALAVVLTVGAGTSDSQPVEPASR